MDNRSKSSLRELDMNLSRRGFFQKTAALGGLGLMGRSGLNTASAATVDLPMVNGRRELAVYPQKRELILMTARPVQLETPFHIFNDNVYTPNDAFFVRWHLAGIPTSIEAANNQGRGRGSPTRG